MHAHNKDSYLFGSPAAELGSFDNSGYLGSSDVFTVEKDKANGQLHSNGTLPSVTADDKNERGKASRQTYSLKNTLLGLLSMLMATVFLAVGQSSNQVRFCILSPTTGMGNDFLVKRRVCQG